MTEPDTSSRRTKVRSPLLSRARKPEPPAPRWLLGLALTGIAGFYGLFWFRSQPWLFAIVLPVAFLVGVLWGRAYFTFVAWYNGFGEQHSDWNSHVHKKGSERRHS